MKRRVLTLVVGRDDGVVRSYFGIFHEDKLWLVTAWLINSATGLATPERMIRVDSLPGKIQDCRNEKDGKFDFANILLPKAVIEGISQDTPGYEVRSLPDAPVVHRSELYELPSIFS